jgi:hypothetical protein
MTTEELGTGLGPPSQKVGPTRSGHSALSYPGGFTAVTDSNSFVVAVQIGPNSKGRTKEGIGIGSLKADVLRLFGTPDRTVSSTDTSASIYYIDRGLEMKIGTNGCVESMIVRPKGSPP